VAYVYYIPLHIAGPISPFNSWCFQVAVAPAKPVISLSQWFLGFLRVGASTLLLELLLHVWYYVSINNNRTWSISYMAIGKAMPGWEVAWGGLFTLQFMYLKFLVIWRFFRLWSRADGVDVTENMGRCVNNNFTFAGFWRQWHSSLNKWIVKYLYIPLGGTRTQVN
jgi:D-alanyl-lipoteichoic acid acyltransferase DltB (MBOAT superfamily)